MKISKNINCNVIKQIVITFSLLFTLAGCIKPEVNYNEMFSPPSAIIINNKLIIKGGPSNIASASYVIPHAKIKENKIYVYGTLSFSKDNSEKKINLPTERKDWEIYWINRDGSEIEIQNNINPEGLNNSR